ncbi:MAG: hypothetical protein CM1200mP40_31110 [Gammaproteobacteria bacterium]|nr:MAG: hypothetical protein CM1200mP40_31110 [Gammaproteobacteria bacterium]
MAEINLLREEVEEGELGLVRIRNTLSDVDFEVVEAKGSLAKSWNRLILFCRNWQR